jgi:hypothetical protein
MSGRIDAERILDAFLAPEADRLPDRVIDAALRDIARTPQRRALRVPWRFTLMPALSRATGIAAVVLVAAIGVGGLIYLNSTGGSGGRPTPSPTQEPAAPSNAPTTAPTAAPTPQPTFDPTDPSAWTTYTSAVYGFTMAYPSDWSVYAPATEKWPPDEPVVDEATPWADVFANPEEVDGDSIGMWVSQMPAPTGADLASWEGLQAMIQEICDRPGFDYSCESVAEPTPMCFGQQDCRPAIIVLVSDEQTVSAFFGDPETGVVTVFHMGRQDDFPAAARYGGTVALLKAILTQVDVREPKPGETPH